MKVMSANRPLNITAGVINIITAILTGIFALVLIIVLGLGAGLSGGLSNDPEVIAEAERLSALLDVFFVVCLVCIIVLIVCAILLFIPKVRYKFIESILSILAIITVCVFVSLLVDKIELTMLIIYAVYAIICVLHIVNIFVKGEYKGKVLNDVNMFANNVEDVETSTEYATNQDTEIEQGVVETDTVVSTAPPAPPKNFDDK